MCCHTAPSLGCAVRTGCLHWVLWKEKSSKPGAEVLLGVFVNPAGSSHLRPQNIAPTTAPIYLLLGARDWEDVCT